MADSLDRTNPRADAVGLDRTNPRAGLTGRGAGSYHGRPRIMGAGMGTSETDGMMGWRGWANRGRWAWLFAALAGCNGGDRGASEATGPPFRGVKIEVAAVGDPAILQTVAPER